jgi:hypothetical protein
MTTFKRLSLPALTLAIFALSAGSAQAFITHKYLSQITGLSDPVAVAVDSSSDVYVVDEAANVVDRFGPTGAPLAFSASESYVQGAKLTGTPTGPGDAVVAFDEPRGVAVNDDSGSPSFGDVYVADSGAGVVDVFSATGAYLSQLTGTPSGAFAFPTGLTVDQSTGELYVSDSVNAVVDVFSATGAYLREVGEGILQGSRQNVTVAVNDFTENLYVTFLQSEDFVAIFNSKGEYQRPPEPSEWFRGFRGGLLFVGSDQGSGHVFVAVPGEPGVLDEFGASSTEEFLGSVAGTPAGPFGRLKAVAASPAADGDVYVAEGGVVDVFGPDVVVPGATTGAASEVTAATATLSGTVDPDGMAVTACEFEYGTSTTYGHTASCETEPPGTPIGAGTAEVEVHAKLAGLAPNTTYYYRLLAGNANGSHEGEDGGFATAGPPRVVSESAEIPPLQAGQSTATLHAEVTPDSAEGHETTYYFQYGETTSYGTSIPVPPGDIGSGDVTVSAPAAIVTGLKVGTSYHYRIVAENEYNTSGPTLGPDQTFTTTGAALLEAWSTEVSSTSATLHANINPLGSATTYHFQYWAPGEEAHPTTVPVPDEPVGSGTGPVAVEWHLQGLAAGQEYHYRLVATNTLGVVVEERAFTTQTGGEAAAAVGLPDNRQWQLVSPPDKHGALLEGMGKGLVVQAAADGDGIFYGASAPTEAQSRGNAFATELLSTRGTLPGGTGSSTGSWESKDLNPPHAASIILPSGSAYRPFSTDLSLGVLQAEGNFEPALSAEATEQGPYLFDSATGTYTPLVIGCRPDGECPADRDDTTAPFVPFGEELAAGKYCSSGSSYCGPNVQDATPDLSHIVIGDGTGSPVAPLLKGANGRELYEWSAGKPAAEQLQLVSVLPSVDPPEVDGDAIALGAGGSTAEDFTHAISEDGSRVFWSEQASIGGANLSFMRDMRAGKEGETIELEGGFEAASANGSLVFEGGKECEILESVPVLHDGQHIECQPVHEAGTSKPLEDGLFLASSEDGSIAYFKRGENIYVRHGNSEAQLLASNVGRIRATDKENGAIHPENDPWRASPNGEWFAFMSEAPLTGYDNIDVSETPTLYETAHGVSPQARVKHHDAEVYLYHAPVGAGAGSLVCASCDPSGERPHGTTAVNLNLAGYAHIMESNQSVAATIPGWTPYKIDKAVYDSRFLSNNGRLFFNATDALVPKDVNGQVDVYEFEEANDEPEAPPSDSCTTSTHTGSAVFEPEHEYEVEGRRGKTLAGCVALISNGESDEESVFQDASETGEDVFFLSTSKLTTADLDGTLSMWDAQTCTTTHPCPPQPATPATPCTTEASCKASPEPEPGVFGQGPSETFSGPGNVAPEPTKPPVKLTAAQLRAQKLAAALKTCKKRFPHSKKKRASCEKTAKKNYGPLKSKKHKK